MEQYQEIYDLVKDRLNSSQRAPQRGNIYHYHCDGRHAYYLYSKIWARIGVLKSEEGVCRVTCT
jgi:hypothetical protein